jgi:bacterioferritin-associated ferredoxin
MRSDPGEHRMASRRTRVVPSPSSSFLGSVDANTARLKTPSVRSSPPSMSRFRAQPVQSTRGPGASRQPASADWASASASRAGRQRLALMGLEDLAHIVGLQERGHADCCGRCVSLLQRVMDEERRECGADHDQNSFQFLDHCTTPVPCRPSSTRRLTARARNRNALGQQRSDRPMRR